MPVADLSASATRQRKTEAPEAIQAEYAYMVYVRKDNGQVVITPDLNVPVSMERPPTTDEIFMTTQVIIKDIVGQQYAAMTAQAQLQLNTYMAQQASVQNDLLPNLGNLRTDGKRR
jgi:hypothetical protein